MAHKVAFLPAYYAYAPLTLTGSGGGRASYHMQDELVGTFPINANQIIAV